VSWFKPVPAQHTAQAVIPCQHARLSRSMKLRVHCATDDRHPSSSNAAPQYSREHRICSTEKRSTQLATWTTNCQPTYACMQ
jgi:hypothetical protein